MTVIEAVPSISFRGEPYNRSKPPRRLSSPRRLSHDGRIRSRLFHNLGIDPKESIRRSTLITDYHAVHTKTVSAPYRQPLRDSIGSPGRTPTLFNILTACFDNPEQQNFQSHGKERSRRIVHFDDSVLVVPIPSRHMYSNRIKEAFWTDGDELRNIADKNSYEYATEGWDWKNVLEDDDMYTDMATGEKIHPCWVEHGDTNWKQRYSFCQHIIQLLRLCTTETASLRSVDITR